MTPLLRPWGNPDPGICVLDGAAWVLAHLCSGGYLFSHLRDTILPHGVRGL